MKNLLLIVLLISALFLSLTWFGCSSKATSPDSTRSNPVVVITYDTNFEGETPSGYLNLVLNIAIKNNGYEPFNTSPSNFSVQVGRYSYVARESDLETVELRDGTEIRGKLKFHVPPEAAVPRTGFTMTYSGQTPYNIQWVKSSNGSMTDSNSTASEPIVNIVYSIDRYWLASPGNRYLKVEPPGRLFLTVEMTVENNGYESFNINPEYFSVEASSTKRNVIAKVQGEIIDWRILNIQNNGKYTGTLYFYLPTEVAQSFYNWDYKIMYSGVRSYNIQWSKVKVVRIEIDAARSKLEPVYLPSGGSSKGRLVFALTSELASANASYKLKYHEKSLHNVQFFDSPNSSADINRNPITYPVIKVTYSTDVTRLGESNLLYLVVDVVIENKGYDTFLFLTLADNFYIEAKY